MDNNEKYNVAKYYTNSERGHTVLARSDKRCLLSDPLRSVIVTLSKRLHYFNCPRMLDHLSLIQEKSPLAIQYSGGSGQPARPHNLMRASRYILASLIS